MSTSGEHPVPAAAEAPGGAAPAWFEHALSQPGRDHFVTVDGCDIHYLAWGDPAAPAVLLVHGGAAHARWWDGIGPLLATQYHVLAIDLSGHGDSGRRETYPPEAWAAEVMAVARDAAVTRPPVLVGHSMGGYVSIVAAALHGDELAGAVIVDSPVRRPDPESEEGRSGRMFRQPKIYPDLDTAVEHFHLVPPQPIVEPGIVAHVARTSLRQEERNGRTGWTWKFDPGIFGFRERSFGDFLPQARCRVAVFHGELSFIVDEAVTDYMNEQLGRTAPFVEIPQAYHHLILDQPLAFVAALRAMLADWEHTIPRGGVGLTPPDAPTG